MRLPGTHSVVTGHRCIYTDPKYNMGDFLKPRNVIRVHGKPSPGNACLLLPCVGCVLDGIAWGWGYNLVKASYSSLCSPEANGR